MITSTRLLLLATATTAVMGWAEPPQNTGSYGSHAPAMGGNYGGGGYGGAYQPGAGSYPSQGGYPGNTGQAGGYPLTGSGTYPQGGGYGSYGQTQPAYGGGAPAYGGGSTYAPPAANPYVGGQSGGGYGGGPYGGGYEAQPGGYPSGYGQQQPAPAYRNYNEPASDPYRGDGRSYPGNYPPSRAYGGEGGGYGAPAAGYPQQNPAAWRDGGSVPYGGGQGYVNPNYGGPTAGMPGQVGGYPQPLPAPGTGYNPFEAQSELPPDLDFFGKGPRRTEERPGETGKPVMSDVPPAPNPWNTGEPARAAEHKTGDMAKPGEPATAGFGMPQPATQSSSGTTEQR